MTNVASMRARQLRKEETPAERKLWRALRELNRHRSTHFRQQAPIGPYIADFADHAAKLVIEVDGGQHGEDVQLQHDAVRTRWLANEGYRVLRFWNSEVLSNLDGVMTEVLIALGMLPLTEAPDHLTALSGIPPTPTPSPRGGPERAP
jgi:very-short-patch-repair endonuclease